VGQRGKSRKARSENRDRDLEKRVSSPTKSDLAICLEVAEHLSADRGQSLIEDLCALAHVVLFSAAVPRQGGTKHINERWQSYWAAQFRERGYTAYDVVIFPRKNGQG
jgi:hypothetical protein